MFDWRKFFPVLCGDKKNSPFLGVTLTPFPQILESFWKLWIQKIWKNFTFYEEQENWKLRCLTFVLLTMDSLQIHQLSFCLFPVHATNLLLVNVFFDKFIAISKYRYQSQVVSVNIVRFWDVFFRRWRLHFEHVEGRYLIQLLHEEYEQRTTSDQQVWHSKIVAKVAVLNINTKKR